MLNTDSVPALAPDEAAHSARVAAHLRGVIDSAGGWLPFARFMGESLYAPDLGYYVAGRRLFGAAGDFVTAPELSPLFANCLAVQVAELLERIGGGDIVEYGAGSGRLALELLQALARLDALPRRYRIVEISATLRDEQRALFARSPSDAACVEWLDESPQERWQGVAIANEFMDAVAVNRFRTAASGREAIGVVVQDDGFTWQARPADAQLTGEIDGVEERLPSRFSTGYVSELRPDLPLWIAIATGSLSCGALLIADYGLPRAQYYHPSRDGGTLCAFHRHRRVADVFARPGLQDLTAWVDFSAVADAARGLDLDVAGFTTQAHFLLSLGIGRELSALIERTEGVQRHALTQSAQMLMLPGEMGERFKVMALTRGISAPLTGFEFRDLADSL